MIDDAGDEPQVLKFDTTVPHSARIWNYWLGGKDYFVVDREAGDSFLDVYPEMREVARAVREFLGLSAADNTHEVAQRVAPAARIVYADNDPLVLAHARALLTSSAEGSCQYIDADVRDPGKILDTAAATAFFDGLSLLEPGVMVPVSRWRPEPRPDRQPPRHVDTFGGMARKG